MTQVLGTSYAAHQDPIGDTLIARSVVPAAATEPTFSLDRVVGPFEIPRPRPPGRLKKNAPGCPTAHVWMHLLNQSGAARKLLEEFDSWKAKVRAHRVGDEQPVAEAITYLSNQFAADPVDYVAARRARHPMGNGHVEATCKSLVVVRFKRPSAQWKQPTGGHVLRLRAVALSGGWTHATELLHEHPRKEIRLMGRRR